MGHDFVLLGLSLSPVVFPEDTPIVFLAVSDADESCPPGSGSQVDLELFSEGGLDDGLNGESCATEATMSAILDGNFYGSHDKLLF